MNHEEAVTRAMKLLRLAQSDNPNEAALAAAKAQEIMDRYKLGALGLSAETEESKAFEDEPIKDFSGAPLEPSTGKLPSWKIQLAVHVAKANQCRIYINNSYRAKAIAIVGRPSDAETVRYIYAWLVREADRLAEREGAGMGTTWRNNFRLGVVDTIGNRLREERKATEASVLEEARQQTAIPSDRALVRVENAIVKLQERSVAVDRWVDQNLKLRRGGSGGNARHDPSARDAGRKAGHEISLKRGRGALGA